MSKNSTQLAAFTDYCRQHPEERFWQALRNWSGYAYIMGVRSGNEPETEDTFHL